MTSRFQMGVPIPPSTSGTHNGFTCWLKDLPVDGSFRIGDVTPNSARTLAARLAPKEFTVRRDEGGFYRVWRLQ